MLYIALTAALFAILLTLGATGIDDRMSPYQSFAHALTTIPTAGFSTRADSIESFAAATQWVLVVFMILGGFNFALMYRTLVRRQPQALVRDGEARLYVALLVLGSAIVVGEIWTEDVLGGADAFRAGVFTAVSTMTTTGFSVADYNTWPALAMMTIVGLMFVGGSAGSTTGSVKVVRHLLLGKILRREIDQTLHPEIVLPVRLNRRVVDERTLRAVSSFILLYIGIFILGAALLAIDAARTGLAAIAVRRGLRLREHARERRPRVRDRRPARLVRAVQRLLDAGDDRADVAGPPRDRPDRRPRLTPLLAQRLASRGASSGARLPCPGSSTASTWSPGRITVESSASSERPCRITEISRVPSGSAQAGDALARRRRVALDLELDDLEVLLAELEQVDDPVLGHLVLDEAEHVRGRADRLVDPEQVEVLLVARVVDARDHLRHAVALASRSGR